MIETILGYGPLWLAVIALSLLALVWSWCRAAAMGDQVYHHAEHRKVRRDPDSSKNGSTRGGIHSASVQRTPHLRVLTREELENMDWNWIAPYQSPFIGERKKR